MTKPLLLTCILLSLVAAVFGFLNRGTLATTRLDLKSAQEQLASTSAQLLTVQGELEKNKEEVTRLGSDKDKLSAELGEARGELAKTKEELIAAQKQAEDLESDSQAKDAKKLMKPEGEWNTFRIQAKGNTFTCWINGQKASEYTDAKFSGAAPLGFQIHPGVVMKCEYRNIRLAEL